MKKIAIAACIVAIALVALFFWRAREETPACGPGFVVRGTRCCPPSRSSETCGKPDLCPAPLVMEKERCMHPLDRVLVPAAHLAINAADWEAEGRVPPREIDVRAFYIDRFEVTEGDLDPSTPDSARAASNVTRSEAGAFCFARGGRLPKHYEWIAAAGTHRYPWGDTGAVCRRAAWGLVLGPCAKADSGPDTVGAHPDGATASGIFDLAGNVAEWVDDVHGIVVGGSYRSALAAELRTWATEEVDPGKKLAWVGFRCAYDAP